MPSTHQTVESFHLQLEMYLRLLQAADPISTMEEALLLQLDRPIRLLRWAIVQVDGTTCWCEGAYLKTTTG
jgi:hypothetical protein